MKKPINKPFAYIIYAPLIKREIVINKAHINENTFGQNNWHGQLGALKSVERRDA